MRIFLLCTGILLLGCGDFVSAVQERVASKTGPSGSAPEGWESLEDENSALRLYYQFVDANRQVRFVETLDDVPESLRENVGFVKMASPPPLSPGDAARMRSAARARSGASQPARASAGSGIVLYSADWCGACQKAKRYLAREGIDYEERNIDLPRYAEELLEKTGRRAIPVLDVGGRILTGFSASGYDDLVGRA